MREMVDPAMVAAASPRVVIRGGPAYAGRMFTVDAPIIAARRQGLRA
ncbi:hypothetical protein [Teichococcus deserti]|nr:hypothetical protein [Pseudoroseomonas deserti]